MGKQRIEYICTFCGKKESKPEGYGRPQPGKCPRRAISPEGKKLPVPLPHEWEVNRVLP